MVQTALMYSPSSLLQGSSGQHDVCGLVKPSASPAREARASSSPLRNRAAHFQSTEKSCDQSTSADSRQSIVNILSWSAAMSSSSSSSPLSDGMGDCEPPLPLMAPGMRYRSAS